MAIFYPKCKQKHPLKECPLNNIEIYKICELEHPTSNFHICHIWKKHMKEWRRTHNKPASYLLRYHGIPNQQVWFRTPLHFLVLIGIINNFNILLNRWNILLNGIPIHLGNLGHQNQIRFFNDHKDGEGHPLELNYFPCNHFYHHNHNNCIFLVVTLLQNLNFMHNQIPTQTTIKWFNLMNY